ncbi:TonB family protein [Stenotrophomonas lactitubi]|nr:TonB family protein [Stenotrophomonas lactitubi]
MEVARGSGSAALDAAAVEAAYRWRYNAASRDGVPVRGKVRVTVSGP